MGKRVVTYVRCRSSGGSLYVDVHGFDGSSITSDGEAGYKSFQYRGGRGLSDAAIADLRKLSTGVGFHVCEIDIRETQFGREKGVELADFAYVGPLSNYTYDKVGRLVPKLDKVSA